MPQQKLDIQPLDLQPLKVDSAPTTPPKYGEATLTDVITGNMPPPEPSFLESAYDTIFNAPEFIMEPARKFANWFTEPSLATSPTGEGGFNDYMAGVAARAKGFVGGATEGVASLLSPANIVTMGRGRLPQLANQLLGGAQILHGGHELSQGNLAEGLGDIGFGTLGVAAPRITKGKDTAPLPKDAPTLDIQPIEATNPGFFDRMGPDPNLNQGMGNPELAGSQPYNNTGISAPVGAAPTQAGPSTVPPTSTVPEASGSPVGPSTAPLGQAKPTIGTAPMGQVIMIAKDKFNANPALGVEVAKHGFEFDGVHTNGKLRFKKVREGVNPQNAPILETDVGQSRPTPAGVKEHLGPVTDVKKSNPLSEAYHFGRTIMASIDFSGPLRQGIALIHKPEFWKAIKPMFKAWASEDAFRASQDAIAQRPLFRERPNPKNPDSPLPSFADDAGLKLTDLTDLSKREEAIMSAWAEKIPGVRRSNRAYTAFLNNLRADTFESLVKSGKVFGADATANLPLARELANFVNTATGRGSLGKLEQSAVALSHVFFAPRLIASRLQMLNPAYYIMASPQVRKEALKSLFAIAAAGNIVTQLGRMAGGEVSADPTSSDFGKLKIGNTRLDPYGGFQQYIVLASRLLSGKVTSSTSGNEYDIYNPEGPYDPSAGEVLMRFGRGKLHPVLGFAYSLLNGGKEMSGEQMNLTTMNPMENAIAQRFIPILLQDLYELSQNDELPPELKALIGTASAFGMGSQTYGPQ